MIEKSLVYTTIDAHCLGFTIYMHTTILYYFLSYFQNLVEIAPFPFVEVTELREKYTFNITPWSLGIGVAKKGLRIIYNR